MRLSRKKSVTITDNITIPSQVLTAKEYDQSIGSMNNPAASSNKSHFHDAAIAKSAHTAKLRMLSKRAKRKSKKSILKNGSTSTSSSAATTKQKEGVKNSNTPKVSSNSSSKASTPNPTNTNTAAATTAASTMSITVNGKPILNIEPNATPEDVQTFLNTLQCGLNYELEQQQKKKKITNDDDDNDEEDIQDGILPSSTSETEASEASDVELDDILPTTTSETEASAESRDSDIKLGPRATQKFEQMEKDMDAEVSLYDDKLGKSLRTLLEMKSKMSEGEKETAEETDKAAQEGVEEHVSQVAQVVENIQETITDASKEVQSLIFPEVTIQESSTSVGSSFEGEGTTLSNKSWKKELSGYRLTGQTSDIRLNATNDDISVDPSIETIENEGDILIGFDHHVRTGVAKENEKKQRQKSLVDPYQMSLILDGVAVQSLTLGAAAMKMINDMISDAKDNVTTCDVLNGGAEKELEIDLKNSLSVEENEVVEVQAPPLTGEQPPAEQDSSFIHPLILEKLNSFVEQAMVNIEQAKIATISGMEQAKTTTISTITSAGNDLQKAIDKAGEDMRNDKLSFERSTSEDDRDYSIDAHINF